MTAATRDPRTATRRPVARLGLVWGVVLVGLAVAAPTAARTLKIATVVPEGSSWMQEMRKAAKEIRKRTDDRVKLKFYPGGIMGSDETVLRKMRAGQLHGGAFTSGALAKAFPDTELYSLPLLFRSYDEVDYVRERMDEHIVAGLDEAGYVVLAIGDSGFAHLLSRTPIRKVTDLAHAKVWILEGDVMSETALQVAGVSPVPLSLSDVYTGLQTGLIDTVAGPPMHVIAFQWHTRVKYMTDVPLMYLVGLFAVDKRTFGKLSPEDQAVMREVVAEASARLDAESRAGEENAVEALRKQGIEIVSAASDEEVARWYRITEEAETLLRAKDIYDEATIETLHRHLEDFRSQKSAAAP